MAPKTPKSRIPSGITPITQYLTLGFGIHRDLMGVVSDLLLPSVTSTGSWQLTFHIIDESVIKDKSVDDKGLRVKFFRKSRDDLPNVTAEGDVVLVRFMKLSFHQDQSNTSALANNGNTSFVVFPAATFAAHAVTTSYSLSRKTTENKESPKPTQDEIMYAQTLKALMTSIADMRPSFPVPRDPSAPVQRESPQNAAQQRVTPQSPANSSGSGEPFPSTPGPRLKASLIKDVAVGQFRDLTGQVVKMFQSSSDLVELYLTDFTSNEKLHDHGDDGGESSSSLVKSKWLGPRGKHTLKIELQNPHGDWALRNLCESDTVLLKNVRIKLNRAQTELEGNMWPDKLKPTDPKIIKLPQADVRVMELLERREQYKNKYRRTTTEALKDDGAAAKESKSSKKKKRKTKAERKASSHGNREEKGQIVGEKDSDPYGVVSRSKNGTMPKLNPRIIVENDATTRSTFTDLVFNQHRWVTTSKGLQFMMPFVNCKHLLHLKVVDFYPHDLRGFTWLKTDDMVWRWNFWLVVVPADEKEHEQRPVQIQVMNEAAEALLGQQATDLRGVTALLSRLRERLWQLWGDLDERKQDFLNAHPDVVANEKFSAVRWKIKPNNLAFPALVSEIGLPVRTMPATETSEDAMDMDETNDESWPVSWIRIWRLFGTKIQTD